MGHSRLQSELESLENITRLLRILGLACAVLSFFNLGHTLWRFMSVPYSRYEIIIVAVPTLFCVLGLVVYFDMLRRRGDVLFEELSDELQWYVRGEPEWQSHTGDYADSERSAEERPKLEVRIILRTFSKATDLPLVPGRFGPAIYVVINITLSLMTLAAMRGGYI